MKLWIDGALTLLLGLVLLAGLYLALLVFHPEGT